MPLVHDFRDYPNWESSRLLNRLSDVVTEVANLYEEKAMVESGEVRDKVDAMLSSTETSSSGRRDRVTMTVVEPVTTRIELEGQLSALTEEKWFIVRLLDGRR